MLSESVRRRRRVWPPGTGVGGHPAYSSLLLMAQTVREASLLPCLEVPPGWSLSGIDVRSGGSPLWFDSDRAGTGAVVVEPRSGGCANYRFGSQPDGWTALATEASGAFGFMSRERLAQGYAQLSGGLEGP